MQYYGYSGKILYVDLTTRKVKTEPLDLDEARKLIGGFGINQKLAYEILKPDTAPLSPGNPLIFSAGPLIGTLAPSTSKIQLTTKSAAAADVDGKKFFVGSATGGSNTFGLMLKSAGYDNLVITGHADKPCYLKIIDDDVEICDAADLWGKGDVYDVTDELRRRYGNRCGVWAIGRAGENMVTFAHGITDKRNSLGRNGGAAVAGSKNLKAVVVRGTKGVNVHDPRRLRQLYTETCKKAKEHTNYFAEALKYSWIIGEKWQQYYPREVVNNSLIQKRSCTGCPLSCRTVLEVKDGELKGELMRTTQPMYLVFFGRRLELKDYREAMVLTDMVNALGLDYTTIMGMLRFVVRMYERGVITKEDTGGLEIKMGDFRTYVKLLEMIANREGFGSIMADGWFALSEKVGVNAWEDNDGDSIEKGASTMFDGRFVPLEPTRFVLAVNPKGGQHLHPITYVPGHTFDEVKDWWSKQSLPDGVMKRTFTDGDMNTGRLTKHLEDQESAFYSLGVCTMAILHEALTVGDLADYYTAVTGMEMSPQELRTGGERGWTLAKMVNVREGFTGEDDRVPRLWELLIENPIKTKKGDITLKEYFGKTVTTESLKNMYDEYYDEHGWDSKLGIPTREKLTELGLDKYAEALPE